MIDGRCDPFMRGFSGGPLGRMRHNGPSRADHLASACEDFIEVVQAEEFALVPPPFSD